MTRFIATLGHLKNGKNFYKLPEGRNLESLSSIDGIGVIQIDSIKKFFSNKTNIKVLSELYQNILIENTAIFNDTGVLKDKIFMLTGKLVGISRNEAKSLIEKNSGKIINNVSKKLDFLIIGEKPTIKKINIAKELNIKVIDQKEWMKMLNKTS